jgi:nucleotide-binding universal stress UspA family protein
VRLGDEARQLLCHLECPLAIAPRGMGSREKPQLERIGVGFDDGPQARAALELAGSIAGAAGAELEVRGVVDDRVAGGLRTEEIALGGDAFVAKQATSLFNRVLTAAKATGARVRVDVTPGNPADALFALGAEVDLLIIGSGHSGAAGRISLGKTGSALVKGASFPVLVIPRTSDDPAI